MPLAAAILSSVIQEYEMKILSVVGARPNFMKVAPIIGAIKEHNKGAAPSNVIHHVLVHTGQHYDQLMSDAFFTDLNLPKPDVHLGVGSGSHAAQTAEIMRKFEDVLLQERPDVLLVVGDVNSTLACALVTAKISFDASGTRPMIAHVESGLRSFDRSMPEEINRILTDHLSDLLFVTEESGLHNLAQEGVPAEKIHFVGNTMIDSLLAYKDKADSSAILDELGLRHRVSDDGVSTYGVSNNGVSNNGHGQAITPYVLLTLHRPGNVDGRDAFLNILEGLQDLAAEYPIVFPAHPRTRKRIEDFALAQYFALNEAPTGTGSASGCGAIRVIEPLGYLDFLCMMKNATLVVTDSGGIQEETTCLGVPCVTVRENTERPVTVETGTNLLAGVKKQGIREAIWRQLRSRRESTAPEKWDGKTAARILDKLSQASDKSNWVFSAPRH
jgi:UDP-N-acetylglucosamine 2-epimerase (non-hydrolysing)